jgi:altronate dehydratase
VNQILAISESDNVAVALEPLEPGVVIDVRGSRVTVRDAIPSGHKVALVPIGAGEPVIKYGSPIGRATAAITAGDHVHTHNLASTRGRGDLR